MSEVLFPRGRRLYKAMNNNLLKSQERKHLSREVCFEVPKLTNNTDTTSYEWWIKPNVMKRSQFEGERGFFFIFLSLF